MPITFYLGLVFLAAIVLATASLLPVKSVRLQLGALLAADPTTLAPAGPGNKIALISVNFVPTENLVLAGLTLANFTGSTPIVAAGGAQQVGLDPTTGQQVITMSPPAGGWRWITGNAVNLPEVIYGFALLDNAMVTLLGVQLLTTPVQLTAAGQEINLGDVQIHLVLTPLS